MTYQIECPLCNKAWCSNNPEVILAQFYEHLNTHSKEEVQTLKKLIELELRNKEQYEKLKSALMEFEYKVQKIRILGDGQ